MALSIALSLTSAHADSLTLSDVIELVIERDLEIAQATDQEAMMRSTAIVSAALPPPNLTLSASNFPIDTFDIDQEPMTQLVGKITQMLPYKNQSSHYYLAAYFLTVPEYVDGFRFVINEPFGSETIWVIASDEHIEMNASADSIDDIRQKIKQASNQAYGEYSITIMTSER